MFVQRHGLPNLMTQVSRHYSLDHYIPNHHGSRLLGPTFVCVRVAKPHKPTFREMVVEHGPVFVCYWAALWALGLGGAYAVGHITISIH